jgi:hypothetical protein
LAVSALAPAETVDSSAHTAVESGLIVLGLSAQRQNDEDVSNAAVDAAPDAPACFGAKLAQVATPSTHHFA